MQTAVFYRIQRVLNILEKKIPHSLNSNASSYINESFHDLLYLIESILLKQDLTPSLQYSLSTTIRYFLKESNQTLSDGITIKVSLKEYSPVIKNIRKKIKSNYSHSVATIDHSNFNDLENKVLEISQDKLDNIIYACEKDINEYIDVCKFQNSLEIIKKTPFKKNQLTKTFSSTHHLYYKKRNTKQRKELLKDAFTHIRLNEKLLFRESLKILLPGHTSIPELKNYNHFIYEKSYAPWFYAQYRLPNYVLTAIYILIMAKTGWNSSSVGKLKNNDLKIKHGEKSRIQSIKTKTDDNTPFFEIHKRDQILNTSIKLLQWNFKQLKLMKVLGENEKSVWFGWQNHFSQPLHALETQRKNLFLKRNNLEYFSSNHIRVLKASVNYLQHNDLDLVKILLGHSDLQTTMEYLNNSLIFGLNEARILEYQRRFEASVMWAEHGSNTVTTYGLNIDKIDRSLAKNPSSSPTKNETPSDDYKTFLFEMGCLQNGDDIEMTQESIKNIFLLYYFYKNRWLFLYNKNKNHFKKYHMKNIIFLIVILRVIKNRWPSFTDKLINKLKPMEN